MTNPHHINGPSRLELRAACPGSYAAELPLWDEPEEQTEDQAAGVLRHDKANQGMRNPGDRPLILADLPTDDRPLVEAWWGYWDGKVVSATAVILGGSERRLDLLEDRHGTTDAWLLWTSTDGDNVLTVGDLKGQPPCRARSSLQLADYVDGVKRLIPSETRIDRIEVVFVSRAGVDEWRFSGPDYEAAFQRVRSVVARALDPEAPRLPGDHCGNSRAAAACDARRAVAVRSASLLELIRDPLAYLQALAPEQRTATLDSLGLAVERLGEAEKMAKDAIRSGSLAVPGYKVIPGSRKEWKDEMTARTVLVEQHPEKAADLVGLCTPALAEKVLGKAVVEPFVEKRPGTPSVRRVKTEAA